MYTATLKELDMTTSINNHSNFFYSGIAALAVIAPIGFVGAAAALPEGLQRGEFIVSSFGAVLSLLATALVVRAAYALGFSKALKTASSQTNYSAFAAQGGRTAAPRATGGSV
jgi:hypothetical protein